MDVPGIIPRALRTPGRVQAIDQELFLAALKRLSEQSVGLKCARFC